DNVKGKIKEAAGDLTGDDDLKHEGQADKATGKIKNAIDDVKDTITGNDDSFGPATPAHRPRRCAGVVCVGRRLEWSLRCVGGVPVAERVGRSCSAGRTF
ncbi:MAG: CsbD family protein, partial [Candidatus Microthrix parvicella]